MTFNIDIIGTGSSGNSVVIDDTIMIDAGLAAKTLRDPLTRVSAVFITHQHGDHIRPAVVNHLAKVRPVLLQRRVFINDATRKALQATMPKQRDLLEACPRITGTGWTTTITAREGSTYKVEAFELVHDVENYGFVITKDGGERLIYATDTETMEHAPAGPYDVIMVEGNWDEDKFNEMIQSHDPHLQARALRNLRHLSVQKFEEFITRNSHPGTRTFQMHVSDELGSHALVGSNITVGALKDRLEDQERPAVDVRA